ncbi:hypothetical protein Ctob_001839 [Chrysochromulina tobinii]|uniref:Uncharacterized protein n=1 Tax=Chrysochromulina tobinii TaxID=1460289 RepID=A0A0M0J5P3_9EUKA|nr:hypothetical protein Ctob_001839 [Chrysochromulina tobinii]|eukprot:KOO21929.1 hypothetical protein Ctob_001839 [Chrysochromulina sp. CCMP291]
MMCAVAIRSSICRSTHRPSMRRRAECSAQRPPMCYARWQAGTASRRMSSW